MINRSFFSLPAILCCVCLIGRLHAQETIVNPASDRPTAVAPALVKPASITPPAAKTSPPMDDKQANKKANAPKAAGFQTQNLLPATTKAWISIPDAKDLSDRFDRSQFGELAKNKTLKPFADSIKKQVKDLIDEQNVRLNLDVDPVEWCEFWRDLFCGGAARRW